MKPEKVAKVGIACSIFRKEIEMLLKQKQINIPFIYPGSMLHMYPDVLDHRLQKVVKEERQKGNDILLVYGDCCPHMNDFERDGHVERACGMNCCDILLGRDLYRQLCAERVFFLMPEWVHRWREVFQVQFEMEIDNARSFMVEFHSRLVFLDTGLAPIPESLLDEISEYTSLPVEIMPVALERLLASIQEALKGLQTDENQKTSQR